MKTRTTPTTVLTALALRAAKTFRLSAGQWPAIGAVLVGWPMIAQGAITLNPQDPALFSKDGGQSFRPGTVLRLTDASISDFVALYADDADASPGTELDLVATFQVRQSTPNSVDAGNRVVINDGVAHSAIAACIIQNGAPGIGLYSQGQMSDPASYPFFAPVDWQAAPVTIRLRRTATGDVELIEVNGVAPSPRALLSADRAPAMTRNSPTVEFGSASVEGKCTVDYSAFRSLIPARTSVGDNRLPLTAGLWTLGPNPSRSSFAAQFDLPTSAPVHLEVNDVAGRRLAVLASGPMAAGTYRRAWNGRDESGQRVPAGLYFCRLRLDDRMWVQRWVLVR